jgi:hypothetical protein
VDTRFAYVGRWAVVSFAAFVGFQGILVSRDRRALPFGGFDLLKIAGGFSSAQRADSRAAMRTLGRVAF